MLNRWLLTALLFSSMLQTDVDMNHKPIITVGSGLGCHYPPDRLNQAIKEHNTIYLTTESVYPPIQINHPKLTLIGGLTDCGDWKQVRNHSQKSIISGFHLYRPVTINPHESESAVTTDIKLKNLHIINGHADSGGGLHITGPAHVSLQDTVIEHNTASYRGGGMALTGPHVELQIINSLVQFNRAERLGGGISCEGEHRIKIDHEQQIKANQAPLAENYLLDQACFIKINQAD